MMERPACSWSSQTASKPPLQATSSTSLGWQNWPSAKALMTRSGWARSAFRMAPMADSRRARSRDDQQAVLAAVVIGHALGAVGVIPPDAVHEEAVLVPAGRQRQLGAPLAFPVSF